MPAVIRGEVAPRPLRQDAARNRRLVLEAARRIFSDKGLDAGVEEVARAAGVGIGTLYRHFPSKEDLVAATLQDLTDDLLTSAQKPLQRADGSGLWEFLQAAARIQSDGHGLLRGLWQERTPVPQVERIRGLIGELADDARSHGTLRPGVSALDVSLVLHGMRGVIEEANGAERRQASHRYLSIVINGLRTPAATVPAAGSGR